MRPMLDGGVATIAAGCCRPKNLTKHKDLNVHHVCFAGYSSNNNNNNNNNHSSGRKLASSSNNNNNNNNSNSGKVCLTLPYVASASSTY